MLGHEEGHLRDLKNKSFLDNALFGLQYGAFALTKTNKQFCKNSIRKEEQSYDRAAIAKFGFEAFESFRMFRKELVAKNLIENTYSDLYLPLE